MLLVLTHYMGCSLSLYGTGIQRKSDSCPHIIHPALPTCGCWFSSCWLLSTQHPSKYLSPLSYPSTSKVKANILGSVIFFWANFSALGDKKIWKILEIFFVKVQIRPKKKLGFIWKIAKLWNPQNWNRKNWRQINGKRPYCFAQPFMHII